MGNVWTELNKLQKQFPIGSKARIIADNYGLAEFDKHNQIGEVTRLESMLEDQGEVMIFVMIDGDEFPYYQDEIEPAQNYASKQH